MAKRRAQRQKALDEDKADQEELDQLQERIRTRALKVEVLRQQILNVQSQLAGLAEDKKAAGGPGVGPAAAKDLHHLWSELSQGLGAIDADKAKQIAEMVGTILPAPAAATEQEAGAGSTGADIDDDAMDLDYEAVRDEVFKATEGMSAETAQALKFAQERFDKLEESRAKKRRRAKSPADGTAPQQG